MECKEVLRYLELLSPTSYALDWDNVGLVVGSVDKKIEKVYLALDASDEVIDHAITENADLLITHHPLIFQPLKRLVDTDIIGRRLLKLAKANMNYYVMHTNFDIMGMADAAAEQLELIKPEVLAVTFEDEISQEGIGRVGEIERTMTLQEYGEKVKKLFGIGTVMVYGNPQRVIYRVAISPGSGKSMIDDAIHKNAQVLITGDIDYHSGIDAVAKGLSIIDAGHYGIEKIFCPYMQEFFEKNLKALEVVVAPEVNPFFTI